MSSIILSLVFELFLAIYVHVVILKKIATLVSVNLSVVYARFLSTPHTILSMMLRMLLHFHCIHCRL